MSCNTEAPSGLILLNKPKGKSSFHLVAVLRKLLDVKRIGHAGTLDPFATGLMVMLVGRSYTKRSEEFLHSQKEYHATVHLGKATNTYDSEGEVTHTSDLVPSLEDIEKVLTEFQGELMQVPPMFSALKVKGKPLYKLARQGIEVKRKPRRVSVQIELLSYTYPKLELYVRCSGGTYIRSLAQDIGEHLKCYAHLEALERTRVGPFKLEQAQNLEQDLDPSQLELRRQW